MGKKSVPEFKPVSVEDVGKEEMKTQTFSPLPESGIVEEEVIALPPTAVKEVKCDNCGGIIPENVACPFCGVLPRFLWKPLPPVPRIVPAEEIEVNYKMDHPREPGFDYRLENPFLVDLRVRQGWEVVYKEGKPHEFVNKDGSKEILIRIPEQVYQDKMLENTRRSNRILNERKKLN